MAKAHKEKSYERCYHTHPALMLGGFKVYGGACAYPVQDVDIYVALDRGGGSGKGTQPWDTGTVQEVEYLIHDMEAPEDAESFKRMIKWVCTQVQSGKRVHVGCIGGHGRTGTVLAAMAKTLGHENAIQYVRENYCVKAVETTAQINFLHKHFAIPKVKESKPPLPLLPLDKYEDYQGYGSYDSGQWYDPGKVRSFKSAKQARGASKAPVVLIPETDNVSAQHYMALPQSARNLFRSRKTLDKR